MASCPSPPGRPGSSPRRRRRQLGGCWLRSRPARDGRPCPASSPRRYVADLGEAGLGEADLSEADLRAARFRAQRLEGVGHGGDVVGLVRHLLAVQAQDPAAFPLALRARMSGLSVRDLEQARADRLVVRCWGPRGTLHLIAAEDLGWLYPLVKPSPAGSVRRLRQLTGSDIDAEAGASAAAAALAGQGPLTKAQLGSRLASAGLRAEGQAIVHLAFLAACKGLAV